VVSHGRLHTDLEVWIYRDQTLFDLVRPSLITVLAVFIVGLLIAIPKDVQWSRSRRHGRRLKGPELVSLRQFNRRMRADGISFMQTPRRLAKLVGFRSALAIPRAIESSHVLIMGDSGTGKSALIRQLLGQLEDRGDTAIVYDPALEYTPQFYTPERGDVILNPIDARSGYWSPGDELRHEAEALTLRRSDGRLYGSAWSVQGSASPLHESVRRALDPPGALPRSAFIGAPPVLSEVSDDSIDR
jgi:type IV secretory pathway TraG/TraD family ATPase VirD4